MGKRILLVEDSPIIVAAVTATLSAQGYEVAASATFDDLVERGTSGVDLILMDVQMPELFGDDVAMILRSERGVKTPIYLYSALPAAELAERAQSAGIDGYIRKDAGMDHLVERVRAILSAESAE